MRRNANAGDYSSPGEAAAPVKMQPPCHARLASLKDAVYPLLRCQFRNDRSEWSAHARHQMDSREPENLAEALVKRQGSSEDAGRPTTTWSRDKARARISASCRNAGTRNAASGNRQRHARGDIAGRLRPRSTRSRPSCRRRSRGAPPRQGAGRRAGGDSGRAARRRAVGEDEHDDLSARSARPAAAELGEGAFRDRRSARHDGFRARRKAVGSRFTVLKGQFARLERALGQFMLDLHTTEHGYTEVQPPLMVRRRDVRNRATAEVRRGLFLAYRAQDLGSVVDSAARLGLRQNRTQA